MKPFPLLITLLLFLGFYGQAQSAKEEIKSFSAKPFKLTITDYNHATQFEGTLLYVMTDTYVKVFNIPFFGQKKHLVFSKAISKFTKSTIEISSLNLDSLKAFYSNSCVVITSGEEYTIDFKNNISSKRITLHHYYLKQIEYVVKLVNNNLPEKYKINYLTKETKQDCRIKR